MRLIITTVSLSAVLACLTLSAQERQSARTGSPAERFKQPDRNVAAMEAARHYSESNGGQGMLVRLDGQIIFEGYGNGGGKDRAQMLASGTKSFVGVAAMAAVEDGLIRLDDRACESLTEWQNDPVKSQITYRQLLTLTSGLTAGALFEHLDTDRDGKVSKEEFRKLASLGQGRLRGRPELVESLYEQLDTDRSGTLSEEEFRGLARLRPGPPPPAPSGEMSAFEPLWRDAIDPELLQHEALMTYQNSRGAILLEHLDPATGSADPKTPRLVLDSGAANLRQTFNGPEFGCDRDGWSVFYTKADSEVLKLWRARLVDGVPQAAPVFADGLHRQSVLASRGTEAASTRLIYLKGDLSDGAFHWTDLAEPQRETRIVRTMGVDSPRWIDNTPFFVFAEAEGSDRGQVKLHDTATGHTTVVSRDAGVKSFAYGWHAPEFGDEILILALVDAAAIGVWRQNSPSHWERVQTIAPPAESRHKVIGSPEPLVCAGRSYISAVLKSEGGTLTFRDSEVWLFGVQAPDAPPYAERVNAADGDRTRSDPETLVSGNRVHVYYNIYDPEDGYLIGHRQVLPRGPEARPPKLAANPASSAKDYAWETERGPLEIATVPELILRDAARSKELRVRINHPLEGGPYPIVLFSHGAWGSKDGHLTLTEFWASHGYITIQPDHTDSRALGVKVGDQKVFRDWQSRPADVSFILDSLAEIQTKAPALNGKMDVQRIGMSGHSYGANTAQLIGGAKTFIAGRETSFAEPRVTAVALLSGQGPGEMLTEKSWEHFTKPFLVMTGSRDGPTRTGQPAVWRKKPYELSPPGDKYLMWVEGMDHGFGGISGLKDGLVKFQSNQDHIRYTKIITLAFWDAFLKGDLEAKAYLASDALPSFSKGIVKVEHK
ncbi:MAG: serine hydrolase [Pirellulaceae bacterium]|nr:serine hydrolase [Pirellulaceae bacterium]